VLVVEDDPQVLEMAKSMLESLQCEVLTADSGDAALRMELDLDAISILFTDCIMPGKTDGRALVLEAVRRRPGLAVLMTSGNQSSLSTGLPAEANIRFLPKPYTSVQLAQELDALLRRGQRAS
jgi:CheY-like chemotaxis protein